MQKPTHTMRQKTISRIVLSGIAVTGICLVLLASTPGSKPETPGTEEESMENCSKKQENGGGGVIWENISHQFFSSF